MRTGEVIHLLRRGIKPEGSARGALFHPKTRMQGFGAMPPGADANAGAIKQGGKIMRMGVIQRESKNPAAILRTSQ